MPFELRLLITTLPPFSYAAMLADSRSAAAEIVATHTPHDTRLLLDDAVTCHDVIAATLMPMP